MIRLIFDVLLKVMLVLKEYTCLTSLISMGPHQAYNSILYIKHLQDLFAEFPLKCCLLF